MAEPRELVERLEAEATLPAGEGERFSGYGVMACPFSSGDILCHRRFPASSVGPAYTSIWHRDPQGSWRFYQNVQPRQACPRFFGSALTGAFEREVRLDWTGPRVFKIAVSGEDELAWEIRLAPTFMTRAMNSIGGLLPDSLWHNGLVLKTMAGVAGLTLGAGKLALSGLAPNGQHFEANPMLIWTIAESKASVAGRDLGRVAESTEQTRLGDFWIPRRGLFVIGRAFFDAFDESRHSSATSQTGA